MNREDIIRMAKISYGDWYPNAVPPELERFAALVAAAEREACARACDAECVSHGIGSRYGLVAGICAAVIRKRGEK